MSISVLDPAIKAVFTAAQSAAASGDIKTVLVDGETVVIDYPFPSPGD